MCCSLEVQQKCKTVNPWSHDLFKRKIEKKKRTTEKNSYQQSLLMAHKNLLVKSIQRTISGGNTDFENEVFFCMKSIL